MIDHENRIIYVDNSTLSTARACLEKANLQYVGGYRPNVHKPALTFGHAMHAAIMAYYDARAGWVRVNKVWVRIEDTAHVTWSPTNFAQVAFLEDLGMGATADSLPTSINDEERRSIERGLGLIDAYITRWRGEGYENLIINGKPAVEIGFRYPLCTWVHDGKTYDIIYVGYIDRLMRNLAMSTIEIVEFKTTIEGLSYYARRRKPNRQITGYIPAANDAAKKIGYDRRVSECTWDCMFISDRKPDYKKAVKDRFALYGIDIQADLQRYPTSRSVTDVIEWRRDTIDYAQDYARWLFSNRLHWPRAGGDPCHGYSGCQFIKVCEHNGAQEILDTDFHVEHWNPAKNILADTAYGEG